MFLIDFQFLCILAVSVVLQQVLNDLNCFGRVQSKHVFYDKHFYFSCLVMTMLTLVTILTFFELLKLAFSSFGRF